MALLWTTWIVTTLVGLTWAALSFATFTKVYEQYVDAANENTVLSLLVASFFGAALMVGHALVSCMQLFCLTMRKERRSAGFWYGFVTSSSFNLGMIALLSSLVMHGYKNEVEKTFGNPRVPWTNMDTTVFTVTYIVGYVTCAVFLVNFGILYYAKTQISKKERTREAEEALLE